MLLNWNFPEIDGPENRRQVIHYFAVRKFHLAMRAAALVVFPGGFGTCDELFEILTLRQTGKMNPLPIVLAMREYWESVIDFKGMVKAGVVAPADLDLFAYADDAPGIWQALQKAGLHHR